MIITIGGLAGSGTTTASEILSKKMGIPYLSAGDIFRQMAAECNMTILEFSKYAEDNLDIDREIDQRQAQIADESEDLIVEGRQNKPLNIVEKEVLERGKSEARRYQELHGININDFEIYDLIIKTNSFHAESVTKIILTAIEVI